MLGLASAYKARHHKAWHNANLLLCCEHCTVKLHYRRGVAQNRSRSGNAYSKKILLMLLIMERLPSHKGAEDGQ